MVGVRIMVFGRLDPLLPARIVVMVVQDARGTVLDGNYPGETDSRLISPSITLPSVSGDEELHLRFWHWFSYSRYDAGYVQISVYDEMAGEWSDWETIDNSLVNNTPAWSLMNVGLTDYADERVRIAFYHTAAGSYDSTGWYVDDIQIILKVPEFTGNFESGWGDWSADRGVWEVGSPTAGPDSCHGGSRCAGTVLDGNYPGETDSRLISPSITLPSVSGDEELHLRFWHWFSYSRYDAGYVQISVYDEMAGEWSDWETIDNSLVNNTPAWSLMNVGLTDYADERVRIAFYHTAAGSYDSTGWYVDDIQIILKVPEFTGNFESGWGDWSADRGVWEVGSPTAGPDSCHGGSRCAGTVLDGNYPGETDSRLISPSITLPSVSGDEELHLRFWHWFSYSRYDAGYVQISVYDEMAGEWSAWETIDNSLVNNTPAWSLMNVELTDYADERVRIAFYHTAAGSYDSTGWYVDDIQIILKVPECTENFESGWGDWSADRGVWEVGSPTAGPDSCHGGSRCAGTVLDGNYPGETDSRLISPSITLPSVSGDEELHLRFWHWFSYSRYDAGYVQISVYDKVAEEWSDWETIGDPIVNSSIVWSYTGVELTNYADEKVRIAFYHTAAGSYDSTGWYVDDIEIPGCADVANDLLYFPVEPCRIVDTRETSAGLIDASTQRDFHVHGNGSTIAAQGGNATGCFAPLINPRAAHINMIAATPTDKGNLRAFPIGGDPEAGLSVNYNTIDTNLANAGTVKTIIGSGPDITVASNRAAAHTVIEVLGYYYTNGDLAYTPVTPCKIVDTRNTTAGMIGANDQRDFHVYGSGSTIGAQGGNTAGCLAPLINPRAAHINMIAVTPTDKGNLRAFPIGASPTAGLSVNYNTIDTNLANAGTVKTIIGSGPDITVASNRASAHTVIEVLGYYYDYPDGELSYTPVIPCKIVDTRKTLLGPIGADTQRCFDVFGDGSTIGPQGGNTSGCPSPLGVPRAAHINMIAVTPTDKGNLRAFPVGASPTAGLSVNYNTIDTNLANAGTVKTIAGTGPDICVASNGAFTHTVIEVLGYYYSAP